MKTKLLLGLLAVALLGATRAESADITPEYMKQAWAQEYTWHGGYYDPQWGGAVALVVPPTAKREYSYGWGVNSTRLSRINHQFSRGWRSGTGGPFYPAPAWPQDTTQMGVYYVRGPW